MSPSFTPNWLSGAPAFVLWARRASSPRDSSCARISLTVMPTTPAGGTRLTSGRACRVPDLLSRHESAHQHHELPHAGGHRLLERLSPAGEARTKLADHRIVPTGVERRDV